MTNRGPSVAYHVRARVAAEPRIAAIGPIHVGQLDPGQTITRAVELAADAARVPRRFTIDATAAGASSPMARVVVLPRWLGDRARYHAMARRIVELSREVLAAATGREVTVELTAMDEHGFGFRAAVHDLDYQDPYAMGQRARRGNAALMRVAGAADFERHGDMFLAWFLPHEVVHAAVPSMASWRSERTANQIQPYVTAEVLRRLGDATPYTPEAMTWIYDRYVEELAPFVSPAQRARIDRFAADATAAPPFDDLPLAVLAVDPRAYMYWCARLTQQSAHRGVDLATVLREHGLVR